MSSGGSIGIAVLLGSLAVAGLVFAAGAASLPPGVRAACWAFTAAALVAGIVEIVHRRRLAPADATS
jgi:hypothetical protein